MKINIEGIEKFLKKGKFLRKIPIVLVQHLPLTSLLLFLFSLIFGGILFYIYVALPQKVEPEVLQKQSLLKEDIYKEVLKVWQEQEAKFNGADFKEYSDPFKKIVAPEKEIKKK